MTGPSIYRLAAALIAPALILFPPAARAVLSSAGQYALESSVVDNGGGSLVSGGEYSAKGSAGLPMSPAGTGNSVSGAYVNRAGFYNPPHFTFQKGLPSVVTFNSGSSSLTLPPGAVDKEVFDITFNTDPLAHPSAVDPSLITSANGKMETNEGAWSRLFPGQLAEMSLFDEQDHWVKPFANSGFLAMRYADADRDGILDGSSPPVRADTIRPWVLDTELAMWAKLPASSVDKSAAVIRVPFLKPGVYALLGMVDESVKDTYAFPVPFRPNGPSAGSGPGQTGTEADGITFTNVPQTGDIEIYTLDGRLVRKIAVPAGLTVPKVKWDVRTAGGERAASGTYLWRVVSGSNYKNGKLMVIW